MSAESTLLPIGAISDMDRRLVNAAVQQPNGCWTWQRKRNRDGYGVLIREKRYLMAHRWIYQGLVGPIPEGMTVDHLCFVRSCVNPAHLQLLTPSQNTSRQERKAANVCRRGHAFTPENTRLDRRGKRRCRECALVAQRAAWRRRRATP